MSSIWFRCPIFVSFLSFTENIIGSFFNDPFSVLIVFDNLFFNFIVCILGTVAGYILIIGVSLLGIELLSLIVIEWVLNSFQRFKLPILMINNPALLPMIFVIKFREFSYRVIISRKYYCYLFLYSFSGLKLSLSLAIIYIY